jgi:hypothetical protein
MAVIIKTVAILNVLYRYLYKMNLKQIASYTVIHKRMVQFKKFIRNLSPYSSMQFEFRARFRNDAPDKNSVFFELCMGLMLHCNHRSGHLKTEHTESLLLLRCHLRDWSRGPALSKRSKLLVAHEKLGQFSLLTVYVVPVYVEK